MSTTVTLSRMIDLALGTPDVGSVNFTVLHSLLHAIIKKLNIGNATTEIREEDLNFLRRHMVKSDTNIKTSNLDIGLKPKTDAGSRTNLDVSSPDLGASLKSDAGSRMKLDITKDSGTRGTGTYVPYHQMEDRVSQLEHYWKELNSLPANYELFERTREKDSKPRPVAEMWQNMKLSKSVDANTQGVSKLMSMFEDLIQDTKTIKEANNQLEQKLASSKDLPEMKDNLGKVQENLASLTQRMDELPGDDFFDSLPTWSALEGFFKGLKQQLDQQLDQAIQEKNLARRRSSGRPPNPGPTSNLQTILEQLGVINNRHKELTERVAKLESANPEGKMEKKMADIEKLVTADKKTLEQIASTTDRLFCRIQGIEDQLCCLRQVINKLRGTDGDSGTFLRTEDEIDSLRKVLSKLQCEIEILRGCCFPGSTKGSGYKLAGSANGARGKGTGPNGVPNSNTNGCTDGYSCLPLCLEVDVQNLYGIVNELDENKMDKHQMMEELNQKASRHDLDDKVSKLCFDMTCEGIHTVINDILQKLLDSGELVQNMTGGLENKLDRMELDSFKSQLETKLRCLAKRLVTLQRKCEGCDDGDSAAGTKQPLFTKQHCLSCDRPIRRNLKDSAPAIPSPPGFPMGKVMKNYTKYELDQFKNLVICQGQPTVKPIDNDPYSVFRDCGGRSRSPRAYEPTPSLDCNETPDNILACRDGPEGENQGQEIPITKMKVTGGYKPPSGCNERPQSAVNLRSSTVSASKCIRPASATPAPLQNSSCGKSPNGDAAGTPRPARQPSSTDLRGFVSRARDTLARTLSNGRSERCQAMIGNKQLARVRDDEASYSHSRYARGRPFQPGANQTKAGRQKYSSGSTEGFCGSPQNRKPAAATAAHRSRNDLLAIQLGDAGEEEEEEEGEGEEEEEFV